MQLHLALSNRASALRADGARLIGALSGDL